MEKRELHTSFRNAWQSPGWDLDPDPVAAQQTLSPGTLGAGDKADQKRV